MSRATTHIISIGLIGSGMIAWALAGRVCVSNPDLDVPLNPLGINRSPYGEVFAMAMQGPIDVYFHEATESGDHVHDHHCNHDHEHDHEHDNEHDNEHGDAGEHADSKEATAKSSPQKAGGQLHQLILSLEKATQARTNPKPASDAHKRYLRRKVEDKLRFAYQLDPAHYANYNSLHLFLTEPQFGTRPQLTHSAAKLAEETIEYCLKEENDPRPALTAAAATSNILDLMFNDQHLAEPKFTTTQMRQYLGLLDHCIHRHITLAKRWDETKSWDRLSPPRILECQQRFQFITKFREDATATIARFEKNSQSLQNDSSSQTGDH